MGYQVRYKKCLDSEKCEGSSKEIRSCNAKDCPVKVNYLVAKWSNWTEWSPCGLDCTSNSIKLSYRTRQCETQINQQNLPIQNECIGQNREIKKCENLDCTVNETTPALSEWSEWTECSTKCGIGMRSRIRKCSNLNFKFPCQGAELVMERTVCSSDKDCLPKKNEWLEWSEWSPCSVSCGQGYSTRKRECPFENKCEGLSKQIKSCVNQTGCTTEAFQKPSWSDWSEWSECFSKEKCGFGVKVKKRYCLLNEKMVPNSECLGPSFNSSECFITYCEKSIEEIFVF